MAEWRPPTVSDRETSDALRGLAEYLNSPTEIRLQVSYREPSKPRVGMIVFADGTDWDPGSGEGLYVYKSGGWTAL